MKTKSIIILTILIFLVSSVAADDFWGIFNKRGVKGSGDIVTVERDIDSFTKVKSTGSHNITITVGPEPSLKITFDDNLIEYIDTNVRGRTLTIGSDASFRSSHDCLIEITVPELEYVKLSGSGDIDVTGLKGDDFEFELSGSGEMRAEGEVDDLEVKISGSGDIDTRELIANNVYARVSGSGDIKLYAGEFLKGRVSGSGDIYYYGDPEDVSKSVTGSGRIKKKN